MSAEHHGIDLLPVITLLAVAVVAAPLFKRLGLGAVLGYLAGGLAIGPFGLRVFTEPAAILQVAELGVVMFLFVIGLEMRPSRLWQMRRQIFGLGFAQVVACAALLTTVGLVTGFPVAPSFVAAAGFVLTSTAIVMQLLEERGELASDGGQRIVAILLLEDLMIVPLLAIVAFLAPIAPGAADVHRGVNWSAIAIGAGAIAGLVLAGRASRRESRTRWSWAACPWRWVRSWPACCCPNRAIAISSKSTWSRSAACCSACSSSRSACRCAWTWSRRAGA